MKKAPTLTIVALLATVALSGCIQNVSDLAEKLDSTSAKVEEAAEATEESMEKVNESMNKASGNASTNATEKRELKPPVARVTLFGDNGALVFRSSFIAEDQKEAVGAEVGKFTFISTESEAVSAGATLEKFEWRVDDQVIGTEKKAETTIDKPGLHMIVLKVVDSDGLSDEQMVHVFIMPEPFTVEDVLDGGPLAGVEGSEGSSATHVYVIPSEIDGKDVQALEFKVTLASDPTHDPKLYVTNPAGETSEMDSGGFGNSETLTFSSVEAGEWTIAAETFAGITQAHSISIQVTYLEVVEGADDGHAHSH